MSAKPNRKQLMRYIKDLENALERKNKFIEEECTTKGEVTRMYATMRVAIVEALGEDACQKVIQTVRNLTNQQAYMFKNEAEELFGKNLESGSIKQQIDQLDREPADESGKERD